MSIIVEFRLITSSNPDEDKTIGSFNLRQVPSVGELVNVGGEPYVVYARSWALGDEQYAYLRVTQLQALTKRPHFHWEVRAGLPTSTACRLDPCPKSSPLVDQRATDLA